MKTLIFFCILSAFAGSFALADERMGEKVEVDLQRIFIPKAGYDDNDRVEVVLQGELPHPCYTLTETEVEKVTPAAQAHEYRVRQMGWRRLDGACAGKLPHLPIPFQLTATLGRLAAGDYAVWFHGCNGEPQSKRFNVETSKGGSVDNYRYLRVDAIAAQPRYRRGEPVTITIEGTIPATCLELEHDLEATLLDDTILILPRLITNLEDCRMSERQVKATFVLPGLQKGNYLIHVRTQGGAAAYRSLKVDAE